MLIFMLAAAMTLAMLIATAFGIQQEAQKVTLDRRQSQAERNRFQYNGRSRY